MNKLLVKTVAIDHESFNGYLLRVAGTFAYPYSTVVRQATSRNYGVETIGAEAHSADWFACPKRNGKRSRIPMSVRGDFQCVNGGHLLSADRLCLSTPRICPMCLRNQEFCRRLWDLALYTSCHIHRVEMVDACSKCNSRVCWNRKSVSRCSCGADLKEADCRVASEHSLIVSEMLSAIYLYEDPRSIVPLLGVGNTSLLSI